MEVNGTLVWYYNICQREVWLMYRNILPDQHDENIDLGRFIHERTYKRNEKEISFGNVKFDVLLKTKDEITIGETKKSSKYADASKWQLLYYLWLLKNAGVKAKGVLLYPEERKRTEVILDSGNESKLLEMCKKIEKICLSTTPAKAKKIPYCKNCAYKEYCFS